MTKIAVDDVLAALRFAPNGMTTAEMAAHLKRKNVAVGSKLSKLADYGRIDREFERVPGAGNNGQPMRICRWRSKDVVEVSNA